MTTTTIRTFDVPSTRLWSVLIDPATYPEWLTGAKKIRSVDPTWPAPGSAFRHVVGFGPLAIPDSTTSTDVVAGESLAMTVRARPLLEAAVRFEIVSTSGGCTLTMHERPIGVFRLVDPLISPLVRLRNERSLDRLTHVVERGR